MKKGDFLWALALCAIAAFLVVPGTRVVFVELTTAHPYLVGFAKFFVLATMGELLARRILTGSWSAPKGWIFRSLIWGFLGMAIVLVFEVFSAGVAGAMAKSLLPGRGSKLIHAFFVSAVMNLTFGPAMMLFHRMTDTFLDMKCEGPGVRAGVRDVAGKVDWQGFINFNLLKTIPFFWIPAHTLVFLLPPVYRIMAAAALSIALGAFLAFGKRGPQSGKNIPATGGNA